MTKNQLNKLLDARVKIREANCILLELSKEKDMEKTFNKMIVQAEDITFNLLVANLNKIEHDAIHIGLKV